MNSDTPLRSVRQLTNEKFINLFSVSDTTRAGGRSWLFASRKKSPLAGTVTADAVVIVPLVRSGEQTRLLLTREYRAPLGKYELSLPSGLIDENESAEIAAARELFEETGLKLVRILHISPPVASSAGLSDEAVQLVYAIAEGAISSEGQTEHEDIEPRLVSLEEVRSLLLSPGNDVISARLYPMLIGFLAAGTFELPLPFAKDGDVTVLYRPVGPSELKLIKESDFRAFPPRLPEQPIFYPVLNEEYATQIARDWNVKSSGAGFVTRFQVRARFLEKYPSKVVGSKVHAELWIPAGDLPEMNHNIVGQIEVIAEFHK